MHGGMEGRFRGRVLKRNRQMPTLKKRKSLEATQVFRPNSLNYFNYSTPLTCPNKKLLSSIPWTFSPNTEQNLNSSCTKIYISVHKIYMLHKKYS